MKIALIGACGKMGKEFASVVKDSNDSKIVLNVDLKNSNELTTYQSISSLKFDIDLIVDFSTSEDRKDYISYSLKNKIPYACFSTNLSKKDKNFLKNYHKMFPSSFVKMQAKE